jgi:hypothetical protein
MGGSNPSYTFIEDAMRLESDMIILARRMPREVQVLRDMKYWSRAELDLWKAHILAGQRGEIPESSVFYWRVLPHRRNETPKVIEEPTRSLCPGARVQWTVNELLYADKLRLPVASRLPPEQSLWNGLPQARTSHIYAVYSVDLFQALLSLHEKDTDFCSLVKEVAQMEHQGPIHVSSITIEESTLTA